MNKNINTVKRNSKFDIYASYGILYRNGKIYHPQFGWIRPLLVNGNSKLGKGVFTFSTLAANTEYHCHIHGMDYAIVGTCPCKCKGCYACNGNYRFQSVINALGMRTWIARNDIAYFYCAVSAQIKADGIKLCRIHASGDFFSVEYLNAWVRIAKENENTVFWGYTKVTEYENAFDELPNANLVKSIIHGFGFNFGTCEYILKVYKALKSMGKSVYICRCGIDKNQHCTNCNACARFDYVLFIEHGTNYKAEKDPLFDTVKALIESQDTAVLTCAAN